MNQPIVDLIIPALNEEASIALVLNDLPQSVRTIYVVDNGSTDRTSKISGTISGSVKAGVKILFMIAKYGVASWKMKLQEYQNEALAVPSISNSRGR